MTIPMRLGNVLSPHIVVFLLFSTVVGSDKYRVRQVAWHGLPSVLEAKKATPKY